MSEVLLVDPLNDLEGLNGDSFVLNLCGSGENTEHRSPTRSKVLHSSLNHLMQTLEDHVASVGVIVVNHGVFERFEEVFLEFEVGELLLLEETHGELTERVESEEGNFRVGVTGDLKQEGSSVSEI